MSGTFAGTWLIVVVGWTLLHFVWQGELVAACLAVSYRVLLRHTANARYAVSMFAMVLLVSLPCLTFARLTVGTLSTKSNKLVQTIGVNRES
ncbi:MAG: hypothetical protein NVSMB56_15180 [Pyrinomonadaceae bacterium]